MPEAIPDRAAMLLAGVLAVGLACGAGASVLLHDRDRPSVVAHRPVVADLPLVDQDGNSRTMAAWAGRLIVLDFIYTGCGDTCPVKTGQLADVQQSLDPALRDRVEFVSVSIDPEHDTPRALKSYAERNGADLSNWSFLTGELGKVARFAALFDAGVEDGMDAASHITTIRLLGADARVLQRYTGEPVDQMRLLRDIGAHVADPPTQHASHAPL